MTHRRRRAVGGDRQGDGLRAVAIQDGGDLAPPPEPTAMVFSPGFPGGDVELFGHAVLGFHCDQRLRI